LAGLESPDTGEVHLDGALASAVERIVIPPHQRAIGMVFQDLALWPNLTALDNVRLGETTNKAAHDALALCGIEELANRRPGELSGGQQQRVALARAIAAAPSFLFLDEPFGGLDWTTKSTLLDMISGLARERKLTLLLVSHDPAEVLALARHLVVLEGGRISESGPLAKVLDAPGTDTARHLQSYAIGAIGLGDTRHENLEDP
jgi:ABC-type sulfate/molybdate transport systems ATPase subunit